MTDLSNLTAVVLNWRTPGLTVRAARALIDDGLDPKRVVLVDNCSGDGSADRLRAELPECRLLALDENVGFARANNLGAQVLEGDAYLLVNSDAFVRVPGSVGRLAGALIDPRVGAAVPRLRHEDGSLQASVVPFSGPLSELVRASGLSRLVPNRCQPFVGTHWDHSTTRTIQAAIGAVLLVRGSLWRSLSGFDESRFMYAEDLEFFRRVAGAGFRTRFVADSEFTHLGGASADQRWGAPDRAERVARAEAAMIRDHLGPVEARLTIALMAAGAGWRTIYYRLRGDRPASEALRGSWRGYASAAPLRRERD